MGSNERARRSNRRQLLFVITVLLLIGVALAGLQHYRAERGLLPIHFETAGEKSAEFKVELAVSRSDRGRGLMFRREMPEQRGMLFVFPGEAVRSFYMKNTYIPLDMLFIDAKGEVLGILENVPTLNEEPRSVPKPAQYVLELNGGASARHGIRAGSKMVPARPIPAAVE